MTVFCCQFLECMMNEELTLRWCDEILGKFTFQKRNLAWDSFGAHITNEVKRKPTMSKTRVINCSTGWY